MNIDNKKSILNIKKFPNTYVFNYDYKLHIFYTKKQDSVPSP